MEAIDPARAGVWNQLNPSTLPRLESDGSASGNVQSISAGSEPVEVQGLVRFSEVIVTPDLYGSIAGIGHLERYRLRSGIQDDFTACWNDLTGHHVGALIPNER
jgi:hypothetical protein